MCSVPFSPVAQSYLTLCDPMNRSTPGLPVHHQLPESTQTHVHWVGDATQPSHPLSSPSPPALNLSQHQGLFKWVSSPHQVGQMCYNLWNFAWPKLGWVIDCLPRTLTLPAGSLLHFTQRPPLLVPSNLENTANSQKFGTSRRALVGFQHSLGVGSPRSEGETQREAF